ncbi:ankyrin repeat domain-containing protein 33B isoform X2 [Heterocephalus glaber]|uniref:Ankyrin repeat domain-containing protein 33B isoform X2 n=1 Tax=Heterocephalus glaber TaxID=10181 RepID=A0AAX6P743_HETGA|nr:ankyrin repeat domain-containing protein 33B isoform X2 [Heterocephalus glaber]
MVLLAAPGPSEGGGARCLSSSASPPWDAPVAEDPADHEEDFEDFCRPDARSVAADDAFYPPGRGEQRGAAVPEGAPEPVPVPAGATLLRAAGANDAGLLRALLRRGLSAEDAREADRHGRTGLIVACYHGFVDTVLALAECPHVDVNWQDNEGNTALITAVQAGHATITNYLLNYFPGLDLERRNAFGFTALMKAAMQGRTDCVRALMLAGADVQARDPSRGMSAQEWAAYTGRVEAVRVMQRLLERPCAEQFGPKYKPELPPAPEALGKPARSRNCLRRLSEFLRCALRPRSGRGPDPEDGGVLDHVVRMTTSLHSPAVAIVCPAACPEDPPCVGSRRLAAQEVPAAGGDPRAPARETAVGGPRPAPAPRKGGLLPLALPLRRGAAVPRVRVSRAPAPTFRPERAARKASTTDSAHLQLPKWRYKEAKEERRRAGEADADRRRLAEAQERRAPPWRKRT